jgi:D-alanyl-lipoteichoic acid acyltransferase DltB (MBOAT superfamily)
MAAVMSGRVSAQTTDRVVDGGRIGAVAFLSILAQLGLLTLALRQFQIEGAAFLRLWLLALAGFAIHSFLPLRFRLPFFLALSLAGIGLVLGVTHGAWLVGIGLVLIAICHLPIAFAARIGLLLAVVGVLIAQRAQWLSAPWSEAIWPILGSLFMFRLIVYLYDLRHETAPASPTRTLSYFFMLPNVCFPLFPVVDYKTFRRNYYDDDAYRIYQVGVEWMVRGVVHLILYRIVYYYYTLGPSEVQDEGDLAQYVVSNFLLYLRVSGTFHLIVGMLYLFGFRLPETHHRYLLASSFSDFWRRINIYWKDFMLKIFYYPAYFRMRRLGNTTAMVLATIFVFLMTWFLHAYQWFWLRGTILFVWQDILFWTILGVLVVINSLWEVKHGRDRSLGTASWTLRSAWVLGLKIAAMFCFICVLWSFWTSESLGDWFSLWKVVGERLVADGSAVPVVLAAAMLMGGAFRGGSNGGGGAPKRPQTKPSGRRSLVVTVSSLVILLAVGIEGIYTQLGPTVASFIQPLRSGRLSRLDNASLERGYYENLLQVNRFNSQLWEVYSKRPANWLDNAEGGAMKRHIGGFAQYDLIPSFVAFTNYGTITTNRWGMRDQHYEPQTPAGAHRIALLGPSTVMGWGVGDGETFEALVEDRLNRERGGITFAKYEVLNFGVLGYQPPQQLVALEKALTFSPHSVLYAATNREPSRAARYLVEAVKKGIEIPYPELQAILGKAEVHPAMEEPVALRRMAPFQAEILSFIYRHITEQCRSRGVVPIWMFVPVVREDSWQDETPEMLRAAQAAGFVILNIAGVFKSAPIATIRLAEWDEHPNARGHELIASRLYQEIESKRDAIFKTFRTVEKGK